MYKLSHICLYVFDQDEARDFYTEKLGFEVRQDVTLEGYRDNRHEVEARYAAVATRDAAS